MRANPDYEEKPVDILTFIESKEYLNAGDECWDTVKQTLVEIYAKDYPEVVLCQSIGSGKSYLASIIISYEAYRMLCLKNPAKFYGLATGSKISLMNMSIRSEQAKKVVFGEVKGRVDNSPWFQANYPPDPEIRSELRFPKGIYVIPGNSKETFPLGYNIYTAILDEAAWFVQEGGRGDVAEEIYYALKRRLTSRFHGKGGKVIIITSPRYTDDFVEKLMREHDDKRYTKRATLWEMKPFMFTKGMVNSVVGMIPAELEEEMSKNPEKFKRDYMAIPSFVIEPYIKDWQAIEDCEDKEGRFVFIEGGMIPEGFVGRPGVSYFGHCDIGIKKDACGLAIGHRENEMCIIDIIIRLVPQKNQFGAGEISLAEVRGYLYAIKGRGFNLKTISFDTYQSTDIIQTLKGKGINAELLSVDRTVDPYENLKERIYARQVVYPKCLILKDELKGLELYEGKKIDHAKGRSKDVADGVCGCVYNLMNKEKRFSFGTVKKATTEAVAVFKRVLSTPEKTQIVSSTDPDAAKKIKELHRKIAENSNPGDMFKDL